MRVLVTGATGFIGTHLAAALSEDGLEVVSVGRRPSQGTAINADLSRKGWTKALPQQADLVFHLAQSKRYREFPAGVDDVCAINVDATVELADWARRANVRRLIFASSGNVYGHTRVPADEQAATNAQTMYAASKLGAEVLLRPFSDSCEILITRLFGIYGPRQQGTLFPSVIERVRKGEEITLAGGVGVRLNPLYIDDCVRILLNLARIDVESSYEVLNVGGTEAVTLAKVVETIASLTARPARTRITSDEPTSLVGDVAKLSRCMELGTLLPLREGLSRTIAAMGSKGD